MDIYRDIPVSSPTLSDEENIKYYQSLKNLFTKTNNVFVIEKTVEPIVESPKILQDKDQVAASDIPVDQDKRIRRSYIYPKTTETGTAAGLPYLGARLAYEYLADEQFSAEEFGDNALKIFNKQKKIILAPLQSFAGLPANDKYSFNILINWRKANPSFETISVIDVLSNRTLTNFFTDKVVLVGGTGTSVADRYQIPLNHWSNSVVYGVEILAHVTSSIISAAIDDRQLIAPASRSIRLLLVVFSITTISYLIYKNKNLRSINLYFLSFGYVVCLTLLLLLCAVTSMLLGYWLPISKAIGCVWILYFTLNYFVYRLNEEKRVELLEAFIGDFNHGLGNRLSSIISSRNTINGLTKDVRLDLENLDELNNSVNQKLDVIIKRTNNIQNQVARIKTYQEKIRNFVDFGYLNKVNELELVNINEFIAETVERFISQENYEYQIVVEQIYDPRLKNVRIDKIAIGIVIKNLLDNAFYAVTPGKDINNEFTPTVKVESKLRKKFLEIIIEDNGNGIPLAYQERIFQPFVTFKHSGQGLGLFLVNKIAKIFNGSIKVESQQNQGCKFIFTIPLIY
ncbi:MAG: CHASE2 domain-containing protein [Pleurocapsa sp. SU_5_0]|nr:CHASE2 domain-containing protein [Pleurocapsa sp. SU_5_0]